MKKKSEKRYWEKFYQDKAGSLISPSNFASFVVSSYLTNTDRVLELGCGSGRDTHYIANYVNYIEAHDQSEQAIEHCKRAYNNIPGISFKSNNIRNLSEEDLQEKNFNALYTRFFLHSLTELEEELVHQLAKNILPKGSLIFHEFRTINDPLFEIATRIDDTETMTDHYRRFIDLDKLKEKMTTKYDFQVLHCKESSGFSKTTIEDPVLARLVLMV